MNDGASSEYLALRQEITARALALHLLLGFGSLLVAAGAFGAFTLYQQSNDPALTQTFLLSLPIAFSCLTFGYQANQWTLERIASYLRNHSQGKAIAAGWENYYGGVKRRSELLSFLKVLPLLLPQLIPLILIWLNWNQGVGTLNQILTSIDLALFILVIFSFRYKIGR